MKKFLSIMMIAALSLVLWSCGDDKEEPVNPVQNIESVCANPDTDTHFTFDINTDNEVSRIYLYHVSFSIGERQSPAMNICIDAPCTASGKVFTYKGTDLIPFLMMGETPVPAPDFMVTDLICHVDVEKKTYDIFFKCHGGEFSHNGKLK